MKKNLKKNIAYNSIYRIVVMLTPLITSPYTTRVLGAENLGIFSYCRAIVSYFMLFALLGVSDYGTRMIAKDSDDMRKVSSKFWQIYYLQFLMTSIVLLIYIFYLFRASYKGISILMILQIVSCYFNISWLAFGLEEFKLTSIRSIVVQLCFMAALFLWVRTKKDLWRYTLILNVTDNMAQMILWPVVIKRLKWEKPDWKCIKEHIKPNLVLFLPVIASTIFQQMDKIMIGIWSTKSEVAFYQNAENISTLPTFLTLAVVSVMLPMSSNLMANGEKEKSIELLYKSVKYTSIMNIAMTFGLMAIAKTFVPWYLGDEYARSGELLIYLSTLIFICGFSNVIRHQLLIPNEMDRYFVISILAGAVCNIILNILLIPNAGADGAVIATIISYLVVLFLQCIYTRREISYRKIVKQVLPYFLNGLFMSVIVMYLDKILKIDTLAKIVIEILAGGIIYTVISVFILYKQKDDLLDKIKRKLTIKFL